jgi:hypothetical protein
MNDLLFFKEEEVGDGTNFVISLAGELLLGAESLLDAGLHASDIVKVIQKQTILKVHFSFSTLIFRGMKERGNWHFNCSKKQHNLINIHLNVMICVL